MAVEEAINLVIEQKFQKVCVEMDSKELHLILTNRCKNIDWRIRPLIVDILEFLKLIPDKKGVVNKKGSKCCGRLGGCECKKEDVHLWGG